MTSHVILHRIQRTKKILLVNSYFIHHCRKCQEIKYWSNINRQRRGKHLYKKRIMKKKEKRRKMKKLRLISLIYISLKDMILFLLHRKEGKKGMKERSSSNFQQQLQNQEEGM